MAHVAARADGVCWDGVAYKPSAFDLDGRRAWAEQHIDRLLRIGKDILAGNDLKPDDLPSEDDDRYQFAAACLELAQAWHSPDFITRLPCNFDGSCNGLQHLCYMVRAPEGELVNLLPSATKQDCYGEVTKIVMKSCGHLLKDIPSPRKIIKPTGMTFGYGSGKGGLSRNNRGKWEAHGMTRQVLEELEDRGLPTTWIKRENGDWSPATEADWIGVQSIRALNEASRLSSNLVGPLLLEKLPEMQGPKEIAHAAYAAVEKLMPPVNEIREFLEDLSDIMSKYNLPLTWNPPTGIPGINDYRITITKEVSFERPPIPPQTKSKRYHFDWIVGYKNKVSSGEARQAITANLTHSYDAAHLHRVALAAETEGMPLATVHDCYSFLATRARRGKEILGYEFRRLHVEHDALADIEANTRRAVARAVDNRLAERSLRRAGYDAPRDDMPSFPRKVKWPVRPPKRNLDEDEILTSFFSFS